MNVTADLVIALLVLFFLFVVVFHILFHNPKISNYLSDAISSKEDFLVRSLPSSPASTASPATGDSFLEMVDSSCASTNDSFPPTRLSSPSGEIRLQIWTETERMHRENDFDKEVEEKLKMGEHAKSSPKMPLMSSPRLPRGEQDYTIFYHPPMIKLIPAMVKNTKAKPQKNDEEVGDTYGHRIRS